MKEILGNEFAAIFFDEASNSLILIWKKPATTESYRSIFTYFLNKIKEYKVESIISDIFYQGLVATENRSWLQNVIIPEVINQGVRKVGIITPNDVFSRFYIESVKNGTQANMDEIELGYFNDLISGQAWLMNQEVTA